MARDEALRARLGAEARAEGLPALHARLAALDPVRAAEVHPHDERRLVRALEIIAATGEPASLRRAEWTGPDRVPAVFVGLQRTWEDLDRRIGRRTQAMFDAGVLDEARAFLAAGPSPESSKALGLPVLASVVEGRLDLDHARAEIARLTRRFARRQMTFFRSFANVTWLEVAEGEPAEVTAARVLAHVQSAS